MLSELTMSRHMQAWTQPFKFIGKQRKRDLITEKLTDAQNIDEIFQSQKLKKGQVLTQGPCWVRSETSPIPDTGREWQQALISVRKQQVQNWALKIHAERDLGSHHCHALSEGAIILELYCNIAKASAAACRTPKSIINLRRHDLSCLHCSKDLEPLYQVFSRHIFC